MSLVSGIRTQSRRKFIYRGEAGWLPPFVALLLLPPIAVGLATLIALRQAIPAVGPDGPLAGKNQLPPELLQSGRLDSGLPQSSVIRARDGTVLAVVDDINYGRRVSVALDEVAPIMVQATLAAEDRRFYQHSGVDLAGMARAALQTVESEDTPSGGSTIEMQLVRNLFLSDERTEQTLSRKVRETAAAMEIDRRFSKEQILETYLNVVFYGAMAHGVEAAAQTYFGKSARDLTLAESSLLAGLPQSPTALNPFQNLPAARERQRYVLDQMVLNHMIDQDEADAAADEPLHLATQPANSGLAPRPGRHNHDRPRHSGHGRAGRSR